VLFRSGEFLINRGWLPSNVTCFPQDRTNYSDTWTVTLHTISNI